jgi:hypothetical protein
VIKKDVHIPQNLVSSTEHATALKFHSGSFQDTIIVAATYYTAPWGRYDKGFYERQIMLKKPKN